MKLDFPDLFGPIIAVEGFKDPFTCFPLYDLKMLTLINFRYLDIMSKACLAMQRHLTLDVQLTLDYETQSRTFSMKTNVKMASPLLGQNTEGMQKILFEYNRMQKALFLFMYSFSKFFFKTLSNSIRVCSRQRIVLRVVL